MVGHLGSAIFLFLNVEFTDLSLKMSRNVKKSIERFIQIQYVIAFQSPYWNRHFLFIYFQFKFIISIFKNPLSVSRSVRIAVKAKSITKIWNSLGVFFSYIIYYKTQSAFLQRIFRSAKFIFSIIYLKKKHTYDDDNSHITATILQLNINIAATFHLQCFEQTLQRSCNIPETFLTVL